MTLQQLNYIITVSETGSLNKAAEILYVTQPSLTRAIQELEKELGTVLFYRSGRGVTLTEAGKDFITYARRIYYQYEIMLHKYGKSAAERKQFGVSAQHDFIVVQTFIQMIQEMDANVCRFSIRETNFREVISDVSSAKSQIGIIYINPDGKKILSNLLKQNDLEYVKLAECGICVYLQKEHPLAHCSALSVAQLKEYPYLTFEEKNDAALYSFEVLENTHIITATDWDTMKNLMVNLNGYTCCPDIAQSALQDENYVTVPLLQEGKEENYVVEIGYILKKRILLSDICLRFIEQIEQRLSAI